MSLRGQAVADFLSGANSMRDGTLIGLSVMPGKAEWEPVLHIKFEVPKVSEGCMYELILWDDLKFDYGFSHESTLEQIAFVKCLWTVDGAFYLSLDPWQEAERFPSKQDNDWFSSKSVMLTISERGS